MTLKMVPKPEGYDMREKRATKAESGKQWLPDDALYQAFERINKGDAKPVGAIAIVWYEKLDNGSLCVKYSISNEYDRQAIALLADALADMTA